jgi:hypothetical protein
MCACVGRMGALFSRTVRRVFMDQFGTRSVSYRIRSAYSRYAWCNLYRYIVDVDNNCCEVTGSVVSLHEVNNMGMGYSDGSRAKNIEEKIAWSSSGMFCLCGFPRRRYARGRSWDTYDILRRTVAEQWRTWGGL